MANLQDQLGLFWFWQITKQTQAMNNNPNYSFQNTNPLTWGVQLSAWRAIPVESQIDLWGGAPFNYWPGGGQDHTMDSIDYSGNKIPSWYAPQSFSASSGVSAPQWTTNVGIWDTFSWITPKRDKNIAQSAWQVGTIPPIWGVPTVPVSPTLDINQQQRLANIAKRQWVAGIQQQITPEKPEISPTWLQGAELQAYNQLTPQEQKTFQALATQGIKAQTDYLQQTKAAQEYNKAQEDIFQQADANKEAAEDIQARQQLESAAKQVANLKQNIGYLGSQGQPGVSAAKLDAVGQQVALANKTYDDVVKIDQLNKANRALGQESHALQFTRQMTQLQDDLDSKVNKQIQGALNQFNSAELKGKLDTIPEIEAFQQQLYAQLDGDLSSIMDTNIEARKFLIERYDKLAESQKTQMEKAEKAKVENEKRKNSINKEMSIAKWFYVNDNGEMIRDEVTGQAIPARADSKFFENKDTWEVSVMTPNRDGTYSVSIHKVGTPQTEAPKTIQVDNPDGTKSTMQWTGSQWTPIQWAQSGGSATGDLRGLASQYPWQAWAKNNNPAGITWNSNFDQWKGTAALLQQAGIQYSKGTERPVNEGGNYVTFNTIEDGLKAQQIMMTQTYGNSTVGQMLSSWVWTSEWPNYAKQVAWMAGVDPNVRVSQLSPQQLQTLQMAKIQKESPGLAKLLQGTGQTEQNQDMKMQAQALVQWLGGTEWERNKLVNNIVNTAQKDNISLVEAKKKLGYKTADDVEFAKSRSLEFKTIKDDTRDKLSNANTALTLLNSPQTAIGDVASIVWFLKTIDPSSVARESEVDSVRNARWIIDSLSNQFAQLKEGTKLTDSQRKQLKDSIQTIVDAGNAKYKDYVNTTVDEFEQRGLDPTVYFPQKTINEAIKWTVKESKNKFSKLGVSLADILSKLP